MYDIGRNKAVNTPNTIDVTSKAFGPNDNFKDDSPSELDDIFKF